MAELPNANESAAADKAGSRTGRYTMENSEVLNLREMEMLSYGLFGGVVTAERTPILELNAAFPLSALRDSQHTAGSGSITDANPGRYALEHTTGGDEARLETTRRGRYEPGTGGFTGVGTYLSGSMADASSRAEWGYFDTTAGGVTVEDGFVWGVDTGGLYIRVVQNGSEVFKTYQGDWNLRNYLNIDPFDGKARVFQIVFSYYGAGPVIFQIADPLDGRSTNRIQRVHAWRPASGVSIDNPNLKVGGLVASTAGSDAFTLNVLGRHFQIEGKFDPITRVTAATRATFATTGSVLPVMAFRRKSGFRPVTIGPATFDAIVRQNPVRMQVRIHPDATSLTGASFEAIPETPGTETSLEYDVSATDINLSAGVKVWEGILPAGQGSNSVGFQAPDFTREVPDGQVIVYAVRSIRNTGEIDFTARIVEEW